MFATLSGKKKKKKVSFGKWESTLESRENDKGMIALPNECKLRAI